MNRYFRLLFIVIICMVFENSHAKTWTIQFGGGLGLVYSPKSLNVNVGDTIMWTPSTGTDFTAHPLASTQVPTGASSFTNTIGSSPFIYPVRTAGTYNYQCNVHFALGMTGSFVASASGVEVSNDPGMVMDPVYPNPSMAESMVHFILDNPEHVTLRVFDATGKLVITAANEDMDAGHHMLMIDTKRLSSGTYQYVLQAGDAVLRRSAIVVK